MKQKYKKLFSINVKKVKKKLKFKVFITWTTVTKLLQLKSNPWTSIPSKQPKFKSEVKEKTELQMPYPIKTFPVNNFKSTMKQNCCNARAKLTAYKLLKNQFNKLESEE